MPSLLRISGFLDQLTNRIGKVAAWLLVALMLVIITDVTLRHWFVIGSTKLQELEWHLHGALFLLCIAWAYNTDTHVRIELFSEKWSASARAWIEVLGCSLFLLPYALIVVWFGLDYVEYSILYGESSSSPTGLSNRWVIKATIPAGFTLLALSALSKLIKAATFLFGPTELRPHCGFSIKDTNESTKQTAFKGARDV